MAFRTAPSQRVAQFKPDPPASGSGLSVTIPACHAALYAQALLTNHQDREGDGCTTPHEAACGAEGYAGEQYHGSPIFLLPRTRLLPAL